MNPIKLFNAPYLIQKHTLDFMDLQSIFLLSLCSTRTNSLIASRQKLRFNKIKSIRFKIEVSIRLEAVNCNGSSDIILKLDSTNTCVKNLGTLIVSGTEVGFGKFPPLHPQDCVLIYNYYFKNNCKVPSADILLEAVQSHCFGLFGNNKHYLLDAVVTQSALRLPKLKNVLSSYIYVSSSIEAESIDDFCLASPNQEFIRVETTLKSPLNENSVLYRMKSIHVEEKNAMIAPQVLQKFSGRQAFLLIPKMENIDIVRFVNRWASSEAFEQLEVLSVNFRVSSVLSELVEIEASIGLKKMNMDINPPLYCYQRRIDSNVDNIYPINFETRSYIVRKSDQRVASVLITQYKFAFGVWNLNEEDFLRKFTA